MIGLRVEYTGWAAWLSYSFKRNLWAGSAPFGRAARQSYGVALTYWHEVILPRHFEAGASSRYQHQRRKKPYLRIKRRLALELPVRGKDGHPVRGREAKVIKGGVIDIVRSGQTERRALATAIVRATPTQGVATVTVPRYIVQRSRLGRPRQDRELKTVTDEEVTEVSRVAQTEFIQTLSAEARRARKRTFRVPARG